MRNDIPLEAAVAPYPNVPTNFFEDTFELGHLKFAGVTVAACHAKPNPILNSHLTNATQIPPH